MLDEPWGGLDEASGLALVGEITDRCAQGTTVLLTDHGEAPSLPRACGACGWRPAPWCRRDPPRGRRSGAIAAGRVDRHPHGRARLRGLLPQRPGATLGTIALLALPLHAWAAYATAGSVDTQTGEALSVLSGPGRVHVALAATAVVQAALVELAAALVAHVMETSPSADQWGAWAVIAVAVILLGVAIGLAAGPGVVRERGAQIVVLLGLLVASAFAVAIVHLTKLMSSSSVTVGDVLPGALWCVVAAAVVSVATVLVIRRR